MATLKDSLLNGNNILGWEDMKAPFNGARVDTTLGRIDYNYFNGGIDFASNARYPEEAVSLLMQLPHSWKEGSTIYPHLHFQQDDASVANWLLAYKILPNGSAVTKETDYSGHTLVAWDSLAFTYTSGVLNQIAVFPTIDMTGQSISCLLHCAIFRDNANVSTLFSGSDAGLGTQFAYEFDIHYQLNTTGSSQEFIK